MTNAEFNKELRKIMDEHIKKEKEIIQVAKNNKEWLPGFDSNNGLFKEVQKETWKKVEQLKKRYKEEATEK